MVPSCPKTYKWGRGRLAMVDFERRLVPTRGLEDMVLHATTKATLKEIVDFEKARQVLFSEWGYSEKVHSRMIHRILLSDCRFTGTKAQLASFSDHLGRGRP